MHHGTLAQHMLDDRILEAFERLVRGVAGPHALPAGGAAAVTSIAMGIALGAKVLRISSSDEAARATGERLDALLEETLPEFAEDCRTFEAVLTALRLPRSDAARAEAVRAAWNAATLAPVRVVRVAAEAERLLESCRSLTKPQLEADCTAAFELIRTGATIARENARSNAARLGAEGESLLARELP